MFMSTKHLPYAMHCSKSWEQGKQRDLLEEQYLADSDRTAEMSQGWEVVIVLGKQGCC